MLTHRPTHWGSFSQRLHLLSAKSSTLQNSSILREKLQQLLFDGFGRSCKSGKHAEFCAVIAPGGMAYPSGHCHGATRSSLWIPIDLYLEDCIDGSVAATNAIEILSGTNDLMRTSLLSLSLSFLKNFFLYVSSS